MRKYDSYKDSGVEWIGEIPSHWDITRMKFHLDYQKGKNPKELKFSETEGSEVYLAMDYLRGNPKQMLFVEDVENYVMVDDNEILLLWDGSNAGEFILSKTGILSSTMAVLNLKNIQKDYSWYFFKHFEPQLKESTIGMGVPHVNGEELKNGFVALPPPEEQTAIAAYLDRKTAEIDELIADKKRLLELYEEEKAAIINQAVTKGINPDVPMKDSGIEWLGEIPEHWEVKRLKTIARVQTGRTPKIQNSQIDFFDRGEINWFTPADFDGNNELLDSKRKLISEAIETGEVELFPEYSIYLVSIGATLGKVSFFRQKASANQQINIIIFNQTFNPLFGYYFLVGNKEMITLEADYTTLPILNQSKTKSLLFAVPPFEEQQSIVHHIETECALVNAKKAKTEKLIELLTEYRTALISEVVTGKVKVID